MENLQKDFSERKKSKKESKFKITSFFYVTSYNLLVINMNEIDPSKYEHIINKSKVKSNSRKYLNNLLIRTTTVIIFLISLSIIYKSNVPLKNKISDYFFKDNISFVQIKKFYDKYLGGLLPITKEKTNLAEVFNEKLNYNEESIYYDGVKLNVSESYLVPSLAEGMVVFIGDKENYGKTIIIENLDGIEYWYGNIYTTSLKLYDYVEKGTLVGEVQNDLYMVFSRDGKYLNYEEYIY